MRKTRILYSCITTVTLCFSPLGGVCGAAETPAPALLPAARVLITEIQTGAAAAGDEFVELFNAGTAPVDITGWQVRYRNASAAAGTPAIVATVIATPDGQAVELLPGGYFVLHAPGVTLPASASGQEYAAKLSAADKVVALYAPDASACVMVVDDAVAWGTSTDGEGAAVPAGSAGERLLQRYRDAAGKYLDTDRNAEDFALSAVLTDPLVPHIAAGATPGGDNPAVLTAMPAPEEGALSPLPTVAITGCTVGPVPPDPAEDPDPAADPAPGDEQPVLLPPDEDPPAVIEPAPEEPAAAAEDPAPVRFNDGLKTPQLTELLPNPAAPATDAADEFIELYNSNDEPFYLEGFVLETGLASKRRYTFPAGTILPPRSFAAFASADTKLSLSNAGSQVRLYDPYGNLVSQTDAYQTAKDNQAWALAQGAWRWTTAPTPSEPNIIREPAAKKTAKAAATTAAKKTSSAPNAVKGATATVAADSKDVLTAQAASDPQALPLAGRVPIHTGVLALIAGFALLYGAYEYRRDIANKIHQFRTNRAARRADRRTPAGRRNDRTGQ